MGCDYLFLHEIPASGAKVLISENRSDESVDFIYGTAKVKVEVRGNRNYNRQRMSQIKFRIQNVMYHSIPRFCLSVYVRERGIPLHTCALTFITKWQGM